MKVSPGLEELLKLNIPKEKSYPTTFLDIARMPHYEDVITMLYAYFLDDTYSETYGHWLTNSLFALIKQKASLAFDVVSCTACTQVTLNSGLRLDMQLDLTTAEGRTIKVIIENKIYHHLNNDLAAYLKQTEDNCDAQILIVLSLFPVAIPHSVTGRAINILHKEVLASIDNNMIKTIVNDRQRVYAEDFYYTIAKLNNIYNMNQSVEFFFEHTSKVNDAIATKQEAVNYILSEIRVAGELLGLKDTEWTKADPYRYLSETDEDELYYTIYFDGLLTGENSIWIIVEVSGETLKLATKIKETVKQFAAKDMQIFAEEEKSYIHILSKNYILGNDELKTFGKFVAEKIRKDFDEVFQRIKLLIIEEKAEAKNVRTNL